MKEETKNKENTPEQEEADQPRSFKIDLPDVEDIPGQEDIYPEGIGAVGSDITIASDDEEGVGLFDAAQAVTDNAFDDTDTDDYLTPAQKDALEQTGNEEDRDLRSAAVNNTDDDGTLLNEKNEEDDLDIPGAGLDDEDENIGEEDEENNDYSLPDDEL